ncbi:sugar phosphate isomerase/epimerase [Paenibacillus tianjinensis]|uniref:Sugar phosphate isomerase/epimerase n=2 Tax=Paenibacillus tianjinensis TaxID=2810347 RepID=A0ABX7LPU0_9BACL|nr:sugar phosphate isomerase/epimerase [Paenibacillus tianjinensis]
MQQFMIGQYGGFDDKKYLKDFQNGFYGIEACLFASREDAELLIEAARSRGFQIGVHFPFRANAARVRDPLVLAGDDTVRNDAFQHILEELEYLTAIQPEYVLFHYPKPVILDERVNWAGWRFGDRREFIHEHEITVEELTIRTAQLFEWLDRQSRKYQFMPVLEFDAISRLIYEHDFLEQLLNQYPRIRLCLDTARLFLQDKLDPFFDANKILSTFTKYATLIHLSNVQITDTVQNSHYPVLPELSVNHGWAPIEEYLRIIRAENRNVKIMFEHRSDLITPEQLQRCYTWVDGILNAPD